MKWALALLLAACATAPMPKALPVQETPVVTAPVDAQAGLHETIAAFVEASEARRFEAVLSLLARPLRDRYSPETLARDFETEPLAAERLKALKTKVTASLQESKDGAALEWAPGHTLRLVREGELWRIAALE